MKKLILITILVGLIATPALADPTPWSPHLGWWDPDNPRATHQYWEFEPENVERDGVFWDWIAYPTERDNPGTVLALIAADIYDPVDAMAMHPGFLDSEEIGVLLEISNYPEPLQYKELWVDVWYVGELIEPGAEGQGPEASYETVYLGSGGPSGEAYFGFRIYPNPDKEDIWFTIASPTPGVGLGACLLGIHVDTICASEAFSGAGSGTEEDPYIITNVYELQEMKYDLDAWYELGNDIDASDTKNWNGWAGFEPVGTQTPWANFEGHFDGKGHKITSLYIDRPDETIIGLFGSIINAHIENVGLEDVDITGLTWVGALVGEIRGTIKNCYSTGKVVGYSRAGGLIGQRYSGTVTDCYSLASVSGINYIGGFIGQLHHGSCTNCYSAGSVSGTTYVGGFTGIISGSVGSSNCYWDRETSQQQHSAGEAEGVIEGKTTAEMKQQATFTNWDFDTVWDIVEDVNYPYLGAFENKMLRPVEGKVICPFRGYFYYSYSKKGGWRYERDDPRLNAIVFTEGFHEYIGEKIVGEKVYKDYKIYHEGIDINGDSQGRKVKAAASGKVVQVDPIDDSPAGKKVWIEHGDITKLDGTVISKISTRYLHLDTIEPSINQGKTIAQGTVLGTVGNTGCPTSVPHLHFEVRQGVIPAGDHPDHAYTLPLNPCEFVDYSNCQIPSKAFFMASCPIDLIITDPDGLIISKEINQLPTLADYIEIKYYGINEEDLRNYDCVVIYERKMGDYLVTVIPEPNASSTDTYNLMVGVGGITAILAEDAQIQDIPNEPYIFESDLNRSDFDADGDVDIADLNSFSQHWLARDCNYPGWCAGTDLDYDGSIDFIDFGLFAENWLWETIRGDFDIDGDVDFEDFGILGLAWLSEEGETQYNPACDISIPADGLIDWRDLDVFADNWLAGL